MGPAYENAGSAGAEDVLSRSAGTAVKFENDADASFSNSSIGADAPAAAFGETACADFASARNKHDNKDGDRI